MAKRILAMVLVLVMTMSMLPLSLVSAEAATEVVASPKAGTHTDAGHGDDCGSQPAGCPGKRRIACPPPATTI